MQKRVVITGMGLISPLGLNVSESYNNLISNKSGINLLKFNNSDFFYVGCNINQGKEINQIFNQNKPYNFLDNVIQQSLIQSNLEINPNNNIGLNLGIMGSSNQYLYNEFNSRQLNQIHRLFSLNVLPNVLNSRLSIKYKLQGPYNTLSNACATGLSSIGDGYQRIMLNQTDQYICTSVEVMDIVNLYANKRMNVTKIVNEPKDNIDLSKYQSDQLYQIESHNSSMPFHQNRDGFVMGEGAGCIILESLESALERKAVILAEIQGFHCNHDAYHLTKSNVYSDKINLINCHATSTKIGDINELQAIRKLEEIYQKKFFINGFKSQIGHCFGASGMIETILMIQCLQNNQYHPIHNLDQEINQKNQSQQLNGFIKNSFGFGGVNASISVIKYQ